VATPELNGVEIRVVEDPARAAAELLVEQARAGGHIALSGGSTPGRAYELAAKSQPDWARAHVWFSDERAVPPEDSRSNYRLVRTTLLDSLSRSPEVHRVRGERPAEEAAALYDEELAGVTLDLALNGIGPDGHTASLFPSAPALAERTRRAVAAAAGLEPHVDRVTMTPAVFAEARVVVYLVTGEGKAPAVRSAFADEPSAETPASLVRGRRTVAILDDAAAAELPL
jgi:6-phosphogluconolactonase